MKPEEIHINDIYRIAFGMAPPGFLWEVLLRIAVLVFMLLVAMRLMGKRMSSQLSIQEMAVLVSLAAAIGVPMQTPDRGLLPAVLIAGIALILQRLLAYYSFKNEKAEQITQGETEPIVTDGVLQLK